MRHFSSAAFVLILLAAAAAAQSPDKAHWIWFPDGEPATKAKPGKVWFRAEVPMDGPCTGAAFVACDDKCTLWVNGQKIGTGGGEKSSYFLLNGIVERGTNLIAIEAENVEGRAGLFVAGEIRSQEGRSVMFDTGPFDTGTSAIAWKCTTAAPESDAWLKPRLDDSSWQTPKNLGPHADSPWKAIEFGQGDLDRFQVPEGFSIRRIAEPALVGSVVCITWGNRGRLLVSPEGGPVLSVWDSDGDGTLDQKTIYTDKVTNCQGLCMVFDDLYAVGNGPEGTGVYKLPDKNGDDKTDSIETITLHKGGMGEHGPHNVVFGPDGWLYHNIGNHAWIQEEPQPESPVGKMYEGDLLQPRFEDAGGHAAGIKVPAGTIWRFSPDGKKWWLETAGFRNEYDIAFNSAGDLFTFDSDMEWDVGQPWYRPVRINHCIPGADFGWRSGTANWPEYYFDSLPGTVDIGRGSPTGIIFYEHRQFPEKYRGSLLACDWSMGRILAVFLKPAGATYTGTFETLVAGNPLNVSDIEVDRDGSVVFSTGGRGTEGGIYRVSFDEGDQTPADAKNVDELLDLPQPQSAWAREIASKVKRIAGDDWHKQLTLAAHTGGVDKNKRGEVARRIRAMSLMATLGPKPKLETLTYLAVDSTVEQRAFALQLLGSVPAEDADIEPAGGHTVRNALTIGLEIEGAGAHPVLQRRACEAFVRSGLVPPALPIIVAPIDDRWLNCAIRLATARMPREAISEIPWMVGGATGPIELFVRLHRREDFASKESLQQLWSYYSPREDSRPSNVTDFARVLQLAVLSGAREEIKSRLASSSFFDNLPNRFAPHDGASMPWQLELARLAAALDLPEVTPALVSAMERVDDRSHQIHYALCLAYLTEGWTLELRQRLLDWYETTRDWEGGNSLQGNIANIVGASFQRFPAEDRKELLLAWKEHPHATGLLLRLSKPEEIAEFQAVVAKIIEDVETDPANTAAREVLASLTSALAASPAESSKAKLRTLFDEHPDQREQLARALAAHPRAEDFSYFVRSLQFGGEATLQIALQALTRLDQKPEKADEFRAAIVAGLKLGDRGEIAAHVLAKWTGLRKDETAKPQSEIARYQKWYAEKFPTAPPADLPQEVEGAKYGLAELVNFLENDPRGKAGDVERGKLAFTKANCAKCHLFGKEGAGVGPDLTSVRRRFQRSEIIEALVLPSAVISDQYKSITVQTKDGLAYTGMPVQQPGTKNLVLLLPDATKLEIPPEQIDVQAPAKISVMPADVLKQLTLEEIADLFAYLETSKSNPVTTTEAPRHGEEEQKE